MNLKKKLLDFCFQTNQREKNFVSNILRGLLQDIKPFEAKKQLLEKYANQLSNDEVLSIQFLSNKIISVRVIDAGDSAEERLQTDKENAILRVNMNSKILSSNEFSYNGNTLIIPNVSGDLKIYFDYYTCKRATSLHTEECLGVYCSGMGYKLDGSKGTTTITYGSLELSGTLTTGDTFDCDVNGDGVYNSETEIFIILII